MADTSISRVYQFLSREFGGENFKTDFNDAIDGSRYGNKDGTVIITEFRSFMLNEFDWEEGDNKNDIINSFWKSIDINKGGTVEGTRISNKNALDGTDLAVADFIVTTVTPAINTFMQGKTSDATGAGITNVAGWKDSITTSIINQLTSKIKDKKDIEAMTAEKLQDAIDKAYDKCVRLATADYVALETVEKELGNIAEGYQPAEDKTLQKMINTYIKNHKEDTETSLGDIANEVKTIVSAYANTAAETNANSQVDTLETYGYNSNGKLNDLQKAVLANKITKGINDKLATGEYQALNAAYGSEIEALVDPFVEKTFKNAKASDYPTLISKIDEYVNSFLTVEIKDIQAQYKEFTDTRDALAKKLDGYSADKYKEALKEVFGKETVADAKEVVNGYTTLQEVQDAEAKFDAKVKEIDSRLDDGFWADLKHEYTVFAGTSKPVGKLDPCYGGRYVGDLSFSSSDKSYVDVAQDGTVTINGQNTLGRIRPVTITVTDNNTGVKSEFKIDIEVKQNIAQDNTTSFQYAGTWFGGTHNPWTISSLLNCTDLSQTAYRVMDGEDDGDYEETNGVKRANGESAKESKENIKKIIDTMRNALKSSYPDMATLIDNACDTTYNYYKELIEVGGLGNMYDNASGNVGVVISYENKVTGKTEQVNTSYACCRKDDDWDDKDIKRITESSGTNDDSGLYAETDTDWDADDMHVFVDARCVLRKILGFMGMI